jgi:uncharacterized membrane-anchored protein YhcB (DUF1043 family)
MLEQLLKRVESIIVEIEKYKKEIEDHDKEKAALQMELNNIYGEMGKMLTQIENALHEDVI